MVAKRAKRMSADDKPKPKPMPMPELGSKPVKQPIKGQPVVKPKPGGKKPVRTMPVSRPKKK
jgi:hypothetical protein